MRKKIFNILNKLYAAFMMISFFGGVLPLIPFIIALIIGGDAAETISVFLYNQYYPWVIILGSVAILLGMAAMYVGKLESLSIKSVNTEDSETK